MRLVALAGCAVLAGCAGLLPAADVRYVGHIVPEGTCGAESPATLVVRAGRFNFTPTDGVLLIAGAVGSDGTVAGQLVTPGVDHKPFAMTLAAKITGADVSGSYVTPRCRFSVALSLR